MRAGAALVVVLAGCPLPQTPRGDGAEGAPRIVVSERRTAGVARLVIVDESGARFDDLVTSADETIDVSPAFSPDGSWVAFASSRERTRGSSLWVVPARPRSTPVRLTTGDAVDMTPAWTPDGKAIVFASDRKGSLDLWRIELSFERGQVRASAPKRVTDLPGEELTPSVAPDGRIAFTRIDREGAQVTRSRIAVRAADGAIKDLTTGPADTVPTFSADGDSIAFTAPHLRAPVEPGGAAEVDGDLWRVSSDGGKATLLVDAPATDETGAAWSKDGQWVFATSIYRSVTTGEPLMASIIVVDSNEKSPIVRMLVDPAGAVPRIAVTLSPATLDATALHKLPIYRDELMKILQRAVDQKKKAQ